MNLTIILSTKQHNKNPSNDSVHEHTSSFVCLLLGTGSLIFTDNMTHADRFDAY